jgi:sortase B
MKKRADRWERAAAIARGGDRILNCVIAVILVVALLYSGYGLWDTWQIYRGAGKNSELLKYKPDSGDLSLSDLHELNPDVCAWLTVDGTNIDYPVVQGEDNLEYINQDVYGNFSLSGSVFLDSRNASDFSDYYSLIYAHHMAGKVMFGEIPEFLEEAYFQEHTTGTLYLLDDSSCQIEWFACISTDAYDQVFNPTTYKSRTEKQELLDYLEESAVQYRDLGVTVRDRIIALSTCSEASTDGRVLLFGRVSKNE